MQHKHFWNTTKHKNALEIWNALETLKNHNICKCIVFRLWNTFETHYEMHLKYIWNTLLIPYPMTQTEYT